MALTKMKTMTSTKVQTKHTSNLKMMGMKVQTKHFSNHRMRSSEVQYEDDVDSEDTR